MNKRTQEIIDQTVDYTFIKHPKIYLEEVYKVPEGAVGYKDHLDIAKLEPGDFYRLVKEYKQRTQALQKADIKDKKVKILKYRIIKDLKNEIALHKRWEAFVENPEPKKIIGLTRENDWGRTRWLQKKIEQGNLNALKAAIILSEASSYKSDERTLGLLHCVIASAIITHPQMYIEQLYKNPAVAEQTLTCTETSVMGKYDFDTMINIFEQRIKALQKLILIDKDQDKFKHNAIGSLKDTIQNIKTEFLSGNPYEDQQSVYSLNPKMETMLEQQWQALMKDPSDEKVERLFNTIYKADESLDGFDCSKWLESKIMMFQTMLTRDEEKVFKAAFILNEFLGEALAEEMDIAIASSIASKPKLYLEQAYRCKSEIGIPLLQTKWDLDGDKKNKVSDLKKRIKALKNVVIQDKNLAQFRDKLIKDLEHEVKVINAK